MINKTLRGHSRAHPLLNQPHHLNVAHALPNPSDDAITNPHQSRRLHRPIIHPHLPASAGIGSVTARTKHTHRHQPPINPHTLHLAILAAPRQAAYDPSISSPRTTTSSRRSASSAAPFNIVWLIFFGLMIFSPETLTDVWEWVQDRNDALQVILWLLTLPYMLALAIWESDWQTWLRIVLVIFIAMIWTGITNPSYSGNRPS